MDIYLKINYFIYLKRLIELLITLNLYVNQLWRPYDTYGIII